MASPIPASLNLILPLVQAQLQAVTGLDSSRIMLVARDRKPPHFVADQDLLVQVGDPVAIPGYAHGSGRQAPIIARPLLITVRTRLQTGQSDRDDDWLTDPTYGYLALEDSVINALHGWAAEDAQGNWLTQAPLLLNPSLKPVKEEPPPGSWGQATLAFEMLYEAPVDKTRLT